MSRGAGRAIFARPARFFGSAAGAAMMGKEPTGDRFVHMRLRRGVSLTEVLVATVLLAVGIGGCVGALLVSARLRLRASATEAVAEAVDLRLSWFVARGCAAVDTTVLSEERAPIAEVWRVERGPGSTTISGRAERVSRGDTTRLRLVARRPCL